MSRAVVHRLEDGRWRVTDVTGDWVDDGRAYPEPKPNDGVYEYEADAIRDYLERTTPRDPADEVADADDEFEDGAS